ncbi:tetratricopeptide repeat protein [Psychroserpens sp. Hel_I_66]|uniref:tetratricopeptide repeat protein n=1 Tax=Psychroserpens sp. Hel_I_66 TaxID=1250004 RepID=UPI0006460A36|nr:hypothetical protein [Psychroserpens sp. Hel_I_66]
MKLFYLLLLIGFMAQAQTPKQNFEKAEEFYKTANYSEAITQAEKAKQSLGKTNPKIEALLFMSYYNNEEYLKAKVAYETLKKLVPDNVENSDAFTVYKITNEQLDIKLAELETAFEEEQNKIPPPLFTEAQYASKNQYKQERIEKANEKIQNRMAEEDLYNRAIRTGSSSTYRDFLTSYPKSDYSKEIQALLIVQEEKDLWSSSKGENTVNSYYKYLDSYPQGTYEDIATSQIKLLDKQAYEKAISIGSQDALKYYLDNYKKGEYRSQVKFKLDEKIEFDIYNYAKTNNYIENYENYINRYPYGKYATEVNQIIRNSYFKFANQAYKDKNYTKAISNYSKYIQNYPNGENIDQAQKGLKKATKKSRQVSSRYFGFTYEDQNKYGITLGRLNKDGIGLYTNLRVSPEVLELNYKEPELILTEEQIPEGEKLAVASLSAGISYPVFYPVWLYAGGGINFKERFNNNDNENINDYYGLEGEDYLAFYPEAGLKVRIGKSITLIGGVVYLRGEMLYKVGIGF